MKKYIFAILAFLSLFILSGCGSNSKSDENPSGGDEIAVEMQNNYIVVDANGINFTLAVPITKKVDSRYLVELNGYGLTVNGCSISTTPTFSPPKLVLEGSYNSTEIIYVEGRFNEKCNVAGYAFTANQKVTKGNDVSFGTYNSTFNYGEGGSTPPSMNGYSFYNASTPMEITQANTDYNVKVQLLHDTHPVTGQTVTLDAFSSTYGSVSDYNAVTGTDGYAVFKYTSPSIMPADGSSVTLKLNFQDENNATMSQDIVLNFKADGGSGENPDYGLINASNVIIEYGSQKEDIKAQLILNGVPVAGKTVQMLAFDAKYGSILNSFSVTTDGAGYATFLYMAPETLNGINGQTLTLTIQFDEDTLHLETQATVRFSETEKRPDANDSLPIVVVPNELKNITLDTNSKLVDIPIKVFKDIAQYTEGTVKVELPEKVLDGVDVGLFEEYEVAVNAQGIALFHYTGPSNLQALIDNGDSSSIFKFYHTTNSENKESMTVNYQAPDSPIVNRNYSINISTSGEFSMGIPNQIKTFNVALQAKDGSGNDVPLSSETITSMTAISENTTIAEAENITTSVKDGTFDLRSQTLSGIVPVKVTMNFNDANGDPQVLTTIVNVRVYSGPASAISISYVSTGQDVARAKYIETLAISATDEYGNKINTRPNIALGAIVGYAVDGREANGVETNETKRLFYGRSDIQNGSANGEIVALGSNKANFEDNTGGIMSNVFQYVNAEGDNTDKLVIFGERKNYEAMGKWDITKSDNNTLTLLDEYYGVDRSGLYYAVGHNYYQDQCREDGREWVGSADSDSYQLDDEGTVTVTYKYDYHLAGKDALIWVNLDGIQPDTGAITRVGETVKHTLRSAGLTKTPSAGYVLPKNTSGYGTFIIWHEKAPERYRNAHFGYAIAPGSTCGYSQVAISNAFDARTCKNGASTDGTSYVTFFLSAGDKDCTFDIDRIMTSREF